MELEKEIWKPIVGYEGRYEVSNFGRVKSLSTFILTSRSGRRYQKKYPERIMRLCYCQKYPYVDLSKNGETKTYRVHKLVAMAFVPGYKEGLQVNHKDEDPTNNHADNLEWVTCKENINYGTHNKRVSITKSKPVAQLSLEGKVITTFYGLAEAFRQTGIKRENIGKCCNHKKGFVTAGGYKWKFI